MNSDGDTAIFLDHHSTTPCDDDVVERMAKLFRCPLNPHSGHAAGRLAADHVDASRRSVARSLGIDESTVVFTSGATESVHLAIAGVMRHPRVKHRRIITTAIEHPCVLETCAALRDEGCQVDYVAIDNHGRVNLDAMAELCRQPFALASIGYANNEIGVIQNMNALGQMVRDAGGVLHSDATQAVGRVPIDVVANGIDLLSASAHKFYGPMGVGLLAIGGAGRRVRVRPMIHGGGQQLGRRVGTVATPLVVGLAAALEKSIQRLNDQAIRTSQLRDGLWSGLCRRIEGLDTSAINGPPIESRDRLPGNLNFTLPRVEGEAWIAASPRVCFSSGSACSSVDPEPSHVLRAIGRTESQARRSVRFGVGRGNDEQQIQTAIEHLADAYRKLANV